MKITSCCKTLTYTYTALTGTPMCLECNKPCTLEDTPESWGDLNNRILNMIHVFFQTHGSNPYDLEIEQVHVIKHFITQELARQRGEMVEKIEELHTPNIYSYDGVIYQGYVSKSKIINLIKEK
jgi:hypothetical protein